MAEGKKKIIILFAIFVVFFALHLPGLSAPYHQDEYKWPIIVNPALKEPGGIPHPPVGEFIYRQAGFLIGYDNFRLVPFAFGILNFFLLFYLVKIIFDTRTALWGVGLFTISFYSLLASLMVDTDGAVMPFFFLIALIAYFKITSPLNHPRYLWAGVLVLALIGGFFVKTSFVIAIGALALNFMIERGAFSDKKKFFKYFLFGLAGVAVLGLLLWLAKLVFPFFNLESAVKYWEHFIKFSGRGWLQILIQFSKAIMYTSPLLLLPAFLVDKEIFGKTRIFYIFMALGLVFYLVLFDFSAGALDRYLQFLVIPLCVISGVVFAKNINNKSGIKNYIFPVIISVAIFSIQLFNHFVPPLYPKAEWIERVVSLRWNFLFPFTGGSGPAGFYVSFALIALVWIAALVFARKKILLGILVLGILYNGVFAEEYLFGKINGNSARLLTEAREFISANDRIKKVVVYNDLGGYDIQKTGKYARRLYAAPQFENDYRKFFENFSGHVLYIDIPRIGDDNFYSDYLAACKNIYQKTDKYITAKVLECNK